MKPFPLLPILGLVGTLSLHKFSGPLSKRTKRKKESDRALCHESIKDKFIKLLPPRSGTPWVSLGPGPNTQVSTEWRNGIGRFLVQFVHFYEEIVVLDDHSCKALFYS